MNNGTEVKWLLNDSLELWEFIFLNFNKSANITQVYTEILEDYECRLRSHSGHHGISYYLTEKKGSGISRIEQERVITKSEFEKLYPVGKKAIVKDRYILNVDGSTFELDFYCGELDGLVVLEIELDSENDVIKLEKYKKLPFFIKDVTYDSSYKNKNLFLKINK